MPDIKILIIESDKIVTDIIMRLIHNSFPNIPVEIRTIDNASESIKNKNADIIVCDAHFYGENRVSFVKFICDTHPHTRLLVLTGDTDLNKYELTQAEKVECVHDVLHKPFHINDFVHKLQEAIDEITGIKMKEV